MKKLIASGIIEVSENRIVLQINDDFAKYYRKLIYWEFPNLAGGMTVGTHGCHVTIGQPKITVIDQEKANKWNGTKVEFSYDPTAIYIGGFAKGFVGFYVKVQSEQLDIIKKDVIIESSPGSSFHITLCTTKHLKNKY